ncbi:MAG TPA: hypothetical protein VFY93_02820 [Planctomycetota bacterium]|nr:hypothetical protein [Planctomycetota bacterium]
MRVPATFLLLAAAASAGPRVGLPADCVVVHHFDFDALRKTEVWGRIEGPIREFLGDVMGFEGLFEGMGFGPGKDLDALTFALGGDFAKGEERVYAIARGRIDARKFAEAFAPSGIKPVERDGMMVFLDPESKGKITCAFTGAFAVKDGVLLFAEPAEGLDALRAAMKEGAGPCAISRALEAAPDAHGWSVFVPTEALKQELKKDSQGAPFAALKSGLLTYRMGEQLEIRCSAEADSEDLAKQVAVVTQMGLMGLGLKEKAKLDCKGVRIEGSLSMPLEDAMTMMGMPVDSLEKPGTSAQPVVAEGGPKLEGKGKLQRLALPGQVNALVTSSDGKYVYVERALESRVVLDAGLHLVGKSEDPWGRMAFTPDGKSGFWPRTPGGDAEIRAIPSLVKTCTVERPEHGFDDYWAICSLSDGKDFVVAGWSEVRIFHTDPPSWGEAGKPALNRPIAGAVDAKTALLVLAAGDQLELFDPGALKSVVTLTLPHAVTFDVVAAAGRAWVGTKSGVMIPVDLEARQVLDPVPVGEGDISLARCGNVLVAVAGRFVDRDHHPTRTVAYEIEGTFLREIAAATFMSPCPWNDVAVVPDRHAAILGGVESFVWTYASE